MATTQQVFVGSTSPSVITSTNVFTGGSAVFLVYTGASGLNYEIDSYLQVFLSPTERRNIQWILEENSLTTVSILPIPNEYLGFPMQVDMYASEAIPIEVWVTLPDCSCQAGLDELNTKLNILVASELVSTATNIAGLLLGGVASQILPALLPGAIRTVINILNPSTENILIGLGRVPTPTSFDLIVPALEFFQFDQGFTGAINAITQSGNPATIDVTTLP
jgi:hypothetical protein